MHHATPIVYDEIAEIQHCRCLFLRNRDVNRLRWAWMRSSRHWKTTSRQKDSGSSPTPCAKSNYRPSRIQLIRTKYIILLFY